MSLLDERRDGRIPPLSRAKALLVGLVVVLLLLWAVGVFDTGPAGTQREAPYDPPVVGGPAAGR